MIPVRPGIFIMRGNRHTLSTVFQGLFRCLDISCHRRSRFSVSGKGLSAMRRALGCQQRPEFRVIPLDLLIT